VRPSGPDPSGPDEPDPTRPTVLGVLVDRIAARGGKAHQVWLPPLADPPTLDALLPGLAERPGRGFGAPPDGPPLVVPIGLVDLPFEQRRDPLLIDVSGAGGHVGVVGRPRSGKTTLLRTLIAALALRHTPAEVQFYCLDFGGGSLATIEKLPHVGGVCGRLSPERVSRTLAEVQAVLARRERMFGEHGIESMAAYRDARRRGEFADVPAADIKRVFRETYPELFNLGPAAAQRQFA